MIEGAPDPGLYDYVPYRGRKPFEWPGGKKVAVWVSPNLEYYEIDPPLNPHRKAWAMPHPDVVGYSHRDHANRVGHWRMADVMSKHGFPGSVSLSVALCQHHPEVVADANVRGWEFFSHGIYNTRYSYGMDEGQERAIIEDSIRTVREATGQTIRGWLAGSIDAKLLGLMALSLLLVLLPTLFLLRLLLKNAFRHPLRTSLTMVGVVVAIVAVAVAAAVAAAAVTGVATHSSPAPSPRADGSSTCAVRGRTLQNGQEGD